MGNEVTGGVRRDVQHRGILYGQNVILFTLHAYPYIFTPKRKVRPLLRRF